MRVIYIDDEQPARDNFQWTVSRIPEVSSIELFRSGDAALEWVRENPVDVAFLDIEMPGCNGLSLSRELHRIKPDLRIVFVTAYNQYAMEAWQTDAVGYVLKPYSASDIRNQLERAVRFRPRPLRRVEIRTIPSLSISVDGKAVYLNRAKSRELFALLVDRGESGITTGEGIACLWPDRPNSKDTQSLFRVTFKRLLDDLEKEGLGHIIQTTGNYRSLCTDQVDCDLYRILSGDEQAARLYDGQYLQEYSWAEDRNGQLYFMLLDGKKI
ncbi:MAG: response regulator [Oscillospiraceae bacterium]|nr:response regulator [Oscillospiraceae bacterium]